MNASPASASGVTSSVSNLGVPLNFKIVKSIANSRIITFGISEESPGVAHLTATVVEADGALKTFFNLDTSTSVYDFQFNERSFVELKGGGYAFSWSHGGYGILPIYISYSKDGFNWSVPKKPLPDFNGLNYPWANGFGYGAPILAVDGKGVLALGYTEDKEDGRTPSTFTRPIKVITTSNFKTWSPARIVNASHSPNLSNSVFKIFGLPAGGFLTFWTDSVISQVSYSDFYVARLPFGKTKFEAAQFLLRASAEQVNFAELVPKSAADFTFLFGYRDANYLATIDYATFNASTGKIGTTSHLEQRPQLWAFNPEELKVIDSLGATNIIVSAKKDDETGSEIYKIKVYPSSQTPTFERVFEFGAFDGRVLAAQIDSDDAIQLLYSSGWANIRFGRLDGNILTPGDEAPVAHYGDYLTVGAAKNGAFVFFDQQEWLGNVRIFAFTPATAPIVSLKTTVSGTAKVNQKLSVTAAKFYVTVQNMTPVYAWYRCAEAVMLAKLQASMGCEIIPGATGKTYKLTSLDKQKYILAATTTSNLSGSTSSFSMSTGRVK